jgi:hypothetical protein
MAYVTKAEVRLMVAPGTTSTSLSDTLLDMLIEQSSRSFDLECGVEPEHFEPVAAGYESTELERVFYGDGTHYLKLDPFVEDTITSVDLPVDYTVPDYVIRNGYLVRTGTDHILPSVHRYGAWWPSGVWQEGLAVTVTAVWGYEETPADVKEAVIAMVIHAWRTIDPGTVNLTDLERQSLNQQALPAKAARVASKYRKNTSPAFV